MTGLFWMPRSVCRTRDFLKNRGNYGQSAHFPAKNLRGGDFSYLCNKTQNYLIMNYYLHRISGGENALPLAQALFKKGYLSIGFCDFSEDCYLAKIRGGQSEFDQMFIKGWDNYLPRNRWTLWRFVNEMQPGDIVVVPSPYTFTICEIADNDVFTNESIDPSLLVDIDGKTIIRREEDGNLCYKDKDGIIDLGFYRKIKFVEANDIPRDKFAAQDLYSRMKIRQTNANITDIGESVEAARRAFRDNKPINLKETILDSTFKIVLEKIQALGNDVKFEQLVEWYLKTLGARVETPSKNESPTSEGDADKVGYFDNLGFAIMVQVKKHEGTTDSWAIDQIEAFRKNHDSGEYAMALWVISSCEKFSDEAKLRAEEAGVRLIDGPAFSRMILETGMNDLPL